MNQSNQDKQVEQDAARVKKDLNTMLSNRVTQITDDIEKLTGEAKDAMYGVADTVKKDVVVRLDQYNTKAAEVVENIPGGLVEKTVRYPWVAVSIALVAGLVLGGLLKPSRQIFR
jgi:ElaB/YqjD/DUF883 family membrane-anchored ribosome-binding protein